MGRPSKHGLGRAGYTLLEIAIVGGFAVVVLVKVGMIMDTVNRTRSQSAVDMVLQDQATVVLDRIAHAVMGTSLDRLLPDQESPNHSAQVTYQLSLGVEEGEVVWSEPERIAMEDGGVLSWCRNPGEEDERRIVWASIVRDNLEDELENGVDDNGNGLIDERGLTFEVLGRRVVIRLTLEQPDARGNLRTRTVSTTVTCRIREGGV